MKKLRDNLSRIMNVIDRRNFISDELKDYTTPDAPLPDGFDESNTQPSTIKQMLQWLDPKPGEKILDVGSGTGWTSALLGRLVGKRGFVFAVERIPELVKRGWANCIEMGIKNVSFKESGKLTGLPSDGPFDRIFVNVASSGLPRELIDQLKVGGRMVIPVQNDIWVINKFTRGSIGITKHRGFAFAPLR